MDALNIVNLTPHDLSLVTRDGVKVTIPPHPKAARVEIKRVRIGSAPAGAGVIPLYETQFGQLDGLPDPKPNTIYVTSMIAYQVAREMGRDDVYVTDGLVKDKNNRIIAARALARPEVVV